MKTDLTTLQNAAQRLREGYEHWQREKGRSAPDPLNLEMLCDSLTQRFEFTVEQAWKAMQRLLEADSDGRIQAEARKGSRSALRLAFEKQWIEDFDVWDGFVDLRNNASHHYDQSVHALVLTSLPALIAALGFTLPRLEAASIESGA